MTMTSSRFPIPDEFLVLSRRIGADPMLVQAQGGNSSVKDGSTMWVKASGTELSRAYGSESFVHVDVELAKAEIDGAGDGTCRNAMTGNDQVLRPSIETPFHALLPQRYVFHYHSVLSLCHSICEEGRSCLDAKLFGLEWHWVPYLKPGVPLTRAIRDTMERGVADVFVLGNHGLIVCGESAAQVSDLIDEVEVRLQLPGVEAQKVEAKDPGPMAGERFRYPGASSLACDSLLRSWVTLGSYYPDHVVFLGPSLPVVTLADVETARNARWPAVIVPDAGIYVTNSASQSQLAMLECLRNVMLHIPRDWNPVPLARDAEMELLDWDAEEYRRQLAKRLN